MFGVCFKALIMLMAMVLLGLTEPANAQQDAEGAAPAFKEGDVITYENIEALKQRLAKPIWAREDMRAAADRQVAD